MRRLDHRDKDDEPIPRPDPGEGPLGEVRAIIDSVRSDGDRALIEFTRRFDGVELTVARLKVTTEEIEEAAASADPALLDALKEASARLTAFCIRQLLQPWSGGVEGARLGETVHPVGVAGLYAPGGRATYPSVVVMCAVPAGVAGVGRRVLCVPPGPDGEVPRAILAAAHVTGVDEIYRVGGAQAIAAMAFGTETIPKADVIAGGGGLWVALAKREVAGSVGIDSVAGPSEIAIVADSTADSQALAADLIAQAEHGPHGAFVLITWDESLADQVEKALTDALGRSEATSDLRAALEEGASIVLVRDIEQALDAVSRFAPEHLELICEGAEEAAARAKNAGAIFVGAYSPVSLGDYLAGSNHTLPTMGAARFASGLRASLFQRTSAVVTFDRAALAASMRKIETLAHAEGLPNHARAVRVRLQRR